MCLSHQLLDIVGLTWVLLATQETKEPTIGGLDVPCLSWVREVDSPAAVMAHTELKREHVEFRQGMYAWF